jgi:hypothetical protein
MAKRKIPAWRMRLTNDHDYDRGPGFFMDRFMGYDKRISAYWQIGMTSNSN